nr:hypothetical protein [Rhizobium deserti]
MNEEPHDLSLLIGLHKLAEQNGEGLVPELYALLSVQREAALDMTNVVVLPAASRSPVTRLRPSGAGRILSFGR